MTRSGISFKGVSQGSLFLGKLSQESLDKFSLGQVSKVGLLGGLRFTHGLRLVHGNLGDLRDGERSANLEVLWVEHWIGVGSHSWRLIDRLHKLVVNLLDSLDLDLGGDGRLLFDLRGLVTVEKNLADRLLELGFGLLGLGSLD